MGTQVTQNDIRVTEEAFAFLRIQRGKLWDLRKDRRQWVEGYGRTLYDDFATIEFWLHKAGPNGVLDIGGGLSGVGIMIRRYRPGLPFTVLDGMNDAPKMQQHNETFSNAGVTARFWEENGEHPPNFMLPIKQMAATGDPNAPKFDLVISLQAWCFHLSPEMYLDLVRSTLVPGGYLVVDVRKDRTMWRDLLAKVFKERGTVQYAAKYERVVYQQPETVAA